MTLERKNNQIILTFDKNTNQDYCSICSSGKIGNHSVKPINIDNGIIAYLLAAKINSDRYCMKCSQSIKNLARGISKKYVINQLTFHTVELQSYTHWINRYKKLEQTYTSVQI